MVLPLDLILAQMLCERFFGKTPDWWFLDFVNRWTIVNPHRFEEQALFNFLYLCKRLFLKFLSNSLSFSLTSTFNLCFGCFFIHALAEFSQSD